MTQTEIRWDLYHRIANKECAQTRSLLLKTRASSQGQIRFRNVDTGPEALLELKQRSGSDQVPFVHDRLSNQVYLGKEAIAALAEKI